MRFTMAKSGAEYIGDYPLLDSSKSQVLYWLRQVGARLKRLVPIIVLASFAWLVIVVVTALIEDEIVFSSGMAVAPHISAAMARSELINVIDVPVQPHPRNSLAHLLKIVQEKPPFDLKEAIRNKEMTNGLRFMRNSIGRIFWKDIERHVQKRRGYVGWRPSVISYFDNNIGRSRIRMRDKLHFIAVRHGDISTLHDAVVFKLVAGSFPKRAREPRDGNSGERHNNPIVSVKKSPRLDGEEWAEMILSAVALGAVIALFAYLITGGE